MAFDIILIIFGFLCLVIGLAGSILPLPGPPLSFLGLLLIHWSGNVDFTNKLLWTLGLLTILVAIIDLLVPMWGVKRFGGSKFGIWGSTIGLILGLFGGPWGIFIGAFFGGLAGELLAGRDTPTAMKAAFGSFVGFLFGVLLKLVLCVIMIWHAIAAFI